MEVPYKMAYKIQLRRGTATQWQGLNPVLSAGEPGVELDTGKFKIGNGLTTWNELDYAAGDTPTGEFAPLLHTHTANQITDPDNLLIIPSGPYQSLFGIMPAQWFLDPQTGEYMVELTSEQGQFQVGAQVTYTVTEGTAPLGFIIYININGRIVAEAEEQPINFFQINVSTTTATQYRAVLSINGRKGSVSLTAQEVGAANILHTHTASQITDPNNLFQFPQVNNYFVPSTNWGFNGEFYFQNIGFLTLDNPLQFIENYQVTDGTVNGTVFFVINTEPEFKVIQIRSFSQQTSNFSINLEVGTQFRAVMSLNGQTGYLQFGLNDLTNVEVPNTGGTPLPAGNVLKTTSNDNIFRPGHPLITSVPSQIQSYNFLVAPAQWVWDSMNNYWYVDLLFGFSTTTHNVQSFNINPTLPNGGNVFIYQSGTVGAIRVTTFAPETPSSPVGFDVNIDVTVFQFETTQYNGVVAVNGQSGFVNIQNGFSQAQVFENSVFIGENNGDYLAPNNLFLSSGEYVIDVVVKNLGINNGELDLDIQGPNGGQLVSIPQNNYAFKSYTYFVPIGQNHQVTFTFEKFNGNGLSSNVEFTVKTLKKEFTTA
jgi:hypothetical protein